jgi:hypothetical protein
VGAVNRGAPWLRGDQDPDQDQDPEEEEEFVPPIQEDSPQLR